MENPTGSSPFQPQTCCELRGQIEEVIDRTWDALSRLHPGAPTTVPEPEPSGFVPAIDLAETEGQLVLRAELPGVSRERLDVEVLPRSVTLRGRREAVEASRVVAYHRVESSPGPFERTLPLPAEVEPETARAALEDGVLLVTVTKRADTDA